MPMPMPHDGEDHDQFMDRCMGDDVMVGDFEDNGQRMAVCQAQWEKDKRMAPAWNTVLHFRFRPADQIELRAEPQPGTLATLRGYAAVFDSWSVEMDDFWEGRFRERFAAGAFAKSIKERDIIADWNHNPDWLLGRMSARTLRLSEDEHGLHTEIDLPDSEWGRPILASVERREVTGMSIAFYPERWETEDGKTMRSVTVTEAKLMRVSPVIEPAYPDTSIGLRSALRSLGVSDDAALRTVLTSLTPRREPAPVHDHPEPSPPAAPVHDHPAETDPREPARLYVDPYRAERLREMLARAEAELYR